MESVITVCLSTKATEVGEATPFVVGHAEHLHVHTFVNG